MRKSILTACDLLWLLFILFIPGFISNSNNIESVKNNGSFQTEVVR